MRKIMKLAGVMLLAVMIISSCKKENRPLDLSLNPVGTLATPNDNADVKLDPTSAATVLFKWEPASTDDGGVILYEIAFDKESGDFSKPVFKAVSDGGGVKPQLTISHKDLNKIANAAGIGSSTTGKMKWTVIASKGTNAKPASASRMLQVQRPAGFAENPVDLYITGTATESGTDLTKAMKLRKTEDGVFEIYTSLKEGSYMLTDKNADGGRMFYVDNGIIKEGNSPVAISGAAKAYRLNYDFTSATAKSVAINSVGLYMSAYGTEIGTANYVGNGVFQAPDIAVEFFQFSWGRDERYKFVIHTATGNEYMGSTNANNDQPAGKPASYFYLVPVTNSQWDNTYKFDPSADRKHIKVDVMFQPTAYTHKVTVI